MAQTIAMMHTLAVIVSATLTIVLTIGAPRVSAQVSSTTENPGVVDGVVSLEEDGISIRADGGKMALLVPKLVRLRMFVPSRFIRYTSVADAANVGPNGAADVKTTNPPALMTRCGEGASEPL